MTGKEFLNKVRVAHICYKEAVEEYHCVCKDAESLRAIDYSAPKVSSGHIHKDFADIITRLEARGETLYKEAEYWTDISNQCAVLIRKLNCGTNTEIYQKILRYHYLCHMSWEKIAVELHFTYRWVLHLHGIALKEFEKVFDAEKGKEGKR